MRNSITSTVRCCLWQIRTPNYSKSTRIAYGAQFLTLPKRESSSTSSDPYQVLGIGRDANETTVKNAYIRLSKKFHPDINPNDEQATDMFLRVQNSYREIMKKLETIDPKPEGVKDPLTDFSFTITPLGVEPTPPTPALNRPHVQWILGTMLIFAWILFLNNQMQKKLLQPEKPKKEVIEKVKREYIEDIRYLDQQNRASAKLVDKTQGAARSLLTR